MISKKKTTLRFFFPYWFHVIYLVYFCSDLNYFLPSATLCLVLSSLSSFLRYQVWCFKIVLLNVNIYHYRFLSSYCFFYILYILVFYLSTFLSQAIFFLFFFGILLWLTIQECCLISTCMWIFQFSFCH